MSALRGATLLLGLSHAAAAMALSMGCDMLDVAGPYLYSQDERIVITFAAASRNATTTVYNVSCVGSSTWTHATAVMHAPYSSLQITFDESPPLAMPGYLDPTCTIISFGTGSPSWCATSNPDCTVKPAASCDVLDIEGPYLYSQDEHVIITFSASSRNATATIYDVACTGPSTGWTHATAVMVPPYTGLQITFDKNPPLSMPGYLDPTCTVISFGSESAPWCASSNPNCLVPPDPFWTPGFVHLVQVSHSDVGWLGSGIWGLPPDLIDDTQNMALALDMMRADLTFKWQHECMLFMRVFVDMYPEREAELVARIAEGRFDIGGTFTEGLESTQLNELMARQMYTGRKWFVERYPGLDSAVVAFHQDGPLRAIQAPQVWRKAGMRYLKSSRWSDQIVAWYGADNESGVLAMTEVHYGQAADNVADLRLRLQQMAPQYREAGLPPQLVQAIGTDYSPPTNSSAFLAAWAAQTPAGVLPPMSYSTFKEALAALDVKAPGLKRVRGERPNLWYIEGAPPHHRLFESLRDGARALPAAETWSTWRALVEGSWAAYPSAQLDAAWLNLTLNDHGIAGEPTPRNFSLPEWFVNERSPPQWDLVYQDKWARAAQAGRDLTATAQAFLAGRVNTSAAPTAAVATAVVFNALSWIRNAPAAAVVAPCPAGGAGGLVLTDAETGATVPAQIAAGDATNCTLVFTAMSMPSLGYKSYFAMPGKGAAVTASHASLPVPGSPWTTPYTNAFYSITPAPGGIASMRDLASGAELFDTSALLAGEWVALSYTGMGASETREYAHAFANATSFERLSNASTPERAAWSCIESGPVRVVFATAPVTTRHSRVALELTIYTTMKRVDLRVSLRDWDSAFGIANRIVFPLASRARNVTYAAPFGVVRVGLDEAEDGDDDVWLTKPGPEVPLFERAWAIHPREIADWMHAEGDASGAGVLISTSVGVMDFSDCTGLYDSARAVLEPELLMHTDSNRGPFLPEPGDHDFLFSIIATSPGNGWRSGWRDGVSANNALDVVWRAAPSREDAAAPVLPLRAGLLSIVGDGNASWVTAVKKQDDGAAGSPPRAGVVARFFNVDGVERTSVTVALDAPGAQLVRASRTNLIELDAVEIRADNRTAILGRLARWGIETVLLDVGF